ncbi:MAG: hypothetical protein U5M51_15785 [Emticicia sp.]|nr:hypothetical protein [Emticicia sp.]
MLRIKPEQQHYWSPQLSISFEETEDHKTIIRGMYGRSRWAIFLMGYVFFGLGMFLYNVGLVRMSLKLDQHFVDSANFGYWSNNRMDFGANRPKSRREQTFTIHHFFEDA